MEKRAIEERKKKAAAEREKLAREFEAYINGSGIKMGFELIFAEIIAKEVPSN